MSKITVRKIRYDNVDMEGALRLAENALRSDSMHTVITPNAEIAQMCLEDASILEIINTSDIVLPDGAGVILASKILGTPLREKVAGVDFGEKLLSLAAREGHGVFLLGGKPGVAEAAAKKLKSNFPLLDIRGSHDGYFEKSGPENEAVLQSINDSGAHILFICLGAPLQEKWLYANKEKLLHIRLAACLGGSLDIYAGTVKRAPKCFINMHMEWFYRLLKEPKRIVRMMKLPKFVAGTYVDRLRNRKKKQEEA